MADQRDALRSDYATVQKMIQVEREKRKRFLSGEDRDRKVADCDRALRALGRLGAAMAQILGPAAPPAIDQAPLFDLDGGAPADASPAVAP